MIMTNQEATFNPRAGNGSAYDLMNSYAAMQQQAGIPSQSFYQTPTAKQNWQQNASQQQPWQQQQFSQQPWQQQQFSQQPFYQQYQNQPYFSPQQPFNFGAQQQF